jgi:hypothetical protein
LHLADQGAGDVDLEHPLLWLHLQSPLVYSGEFIFYKKLLIDPISLCFSPLLNS